MEAKKIVKESLYKSCVSGTRRLVDAMIQADSKPQVFICASSIGYYGYRSFGTDQDEDTSAGKDFIAHLNIGWEKEK